MALAALALTLTSIQPAKAASFLANSPLTTSRAYHTSTLLPNGKVLVAGGYNDDSGALSSAELYDPATGTWAVTGMLNVARYHHTATLLPNGQVLVAGGVDSDVILSSAELYDPATEKWTTTGLLNTARDLQTATLLQNGQVLIAGGEGGDGNVLSITELYNPTTRNWTATTNALNTARYQHTATLLFSGQVLVAGGFGTNGILSSTELYNPVTGKWTTIASLNTPRCQHTAIVMYDQKVLIAGGEGGGGNVLSNAELYDPMNGTWRISTSTLATARMNHTATLLPNGQIILMGGYNFSNGYLSSTEVYDTPVSASWTASTNRLNNARSDHTATLLANGQVLIVGGIGDSDVLSSTERFDSAVGTWNRTGNLITERVNHTGTLLTNGLVLVAGGDNYNAGGALSNAETFNPGTMSWTATGSLNNVRVYHTATLLPNGKVLVAGGAPDFFDTLSTAELYDPATGQWSLTGAMSTARASHTATLLPNGKVLVTGGAPTYYGAMSSAELYDPATGEWNLTDSLTVARVFHTATLLPNGKVLVAGGGNGNLGASLSSAELYDPVTGRWTVTGSMTTPRAYHTATLLPNGKVLVEVGNSAELYDPATQIWTPTGSLNSWRDGGQTATLLFNGEVLVNGGYDAGNNAELYDPIMGTWALISEQSSQLAYQTATLLPDGMVVVAGNVDSPFYSAVLFDTGLGFYPSWQPQIATVTSPLFLTGNLTLTGSRFRGISEGSGGNGSQDSPADFPLLQIRSIESGQTMFLLSTNWSTNSFDSASVTNFPPGYALATVFVNGIPSPAGFLDLLKVNASVALSNLNQTYDGTSKSVTATTTPNGLVVDFHYNGFDYAPTNAGSYTVIGTINDLNYQGGVTNTLVINPAAATVTLGNLLQTYDGTGKNVSVTTVPPGLSVNLTYNGSTNLPTNAGSYLVVGTVNDPNGQGSATNILVINPAAAIVTLGNLLQTFDGTPKSVSVTTAPPGLSVNVTYNGFPDGPTKAGSYTVIGAINDPNGYGVAINTLVILKARGLVTLGNLSQTYDGRPKSVSVMTVPPDLPVNVTYNGSVNLPIRVGGYSVIGVINDMDYQGAAINTLTIGGRTNRFTGSVELSNLVQTYDGTAKAVSLTTTPPGLPVRVTYDGSTNMPTNAGSYRVMARVDDPHVHGIAFNTLIITKATGTVTLGNLIQAYDGTAKSVSLTTTPPGLPVMVTYNGSTNLPVFEGSYTVIGSINDFNYQGISIENLIVTKATGSVILGNLVQIYDGAAKAVSVTTTPPGLPVWLTYNGSTNVPTNAGSYTVIGTISDPHYQGIASSTLVINKAAGIVALGNLCQIFNGRPKDVSVTTLPARLSVDLFYNGSTQAPTNEGSYQVLGRINDADYFGSVTNTLVIGSSILLSPTMLPNGAFRFSFTQTPGGVFKVLVATNPVLPMSDWKVLGVVPEIAPGQYQFTDLQASNGGSRFYRVSSQ